MDLYGKIGIWNFRDLFPQKREGTRWSDLLIPVRALPQSWDKKKSQRKLHQGQNRKKMNAIANIFNFRENDYNLVKNTEFLARSIFSSSANFGPLMTNNGALESWHWGKLTFCQKSSSLNFWQPERSRCRRTSTTIDCTRKIWVCCRLMRLVFLFYTYCIKRINKDPLIHMWTIFLITYTGKYHRLNIRRIKMIPLCILN